MTEFMMTWNYTIFTILFLATLHNSVLKHIKWSEYFLNFAVKHWPLRLRAKFDEIFVSNLKGIVNIASYFGTRIFAN